MDLDSDYCSNDSSSDGIFPSTSRTPTPPKSSSTPIKKSHLNPGAPSFKKAEVKSAEGKCLAYLVCTREEKLGVQEKELIALCKSSTVIAERVTCSKYSPNSMKGKAPEIKVTECSRTSFKMFLAYLHTGEIKMGDMASYTEMIKFCVTFEISKLLSQICSIAKKNLSLENCVQLYKMAAIHDLEDLRISAYQYILRSGNAFVEHPNFLKLDCTTLSILISSDDFPVVEVTLFKRLKEWVVEQCKRLGYPPDRKEFYGRVAGLLFLHVRYAQMTPKEFQNEVVPSGLLNAKDIDGINLRHKTHPSLWQTLPRYQFVDRPRMMKVQFAVPLYNNVQMGFRKIAGASSTIKESVRLMVSHDIYLTSIGFFGPAKPDRTGVNSPLTAYSIKIHIEGDYSKFYSRCPAQNATVITRDNFTVDLSNPFQIQRMQPYKLTVWIDGEATQFGVFPMPQAIVLIQEKNELITFHFSDADTDPVPALELSGNPTSSMPLPPNQHALISRQEPRMSGVIRCISFVMKD